MNFLMRLFKRPIKRLIVKELKKKELKERIVNSINEKLDIPKLKEVEEAKLLNTIYDAAQEAIITAIDRI